MTIFIYKMYDYHQKHFLFKVTSEAKKSRSNVVDEGPKFLTKFEFSRIFFIKIISINES